MISATSVEVPPTSKVIALATPHCRPIQFIPITAATGPDMVEANGFSIADCAGATPPFDCISQRSDNSARSLSGKKHKCRSIIGRNNEVNAALKVLSYSLDSLKTSLDNVISKS